MVRHHVGIEIADIRKRLRAAIEHGRQAAAAKRVKVDQAEKEYDDFRTAIAEPIVQMLANALRAEGFQFAVFTPARGLKLASSRSEDDFIEFALDTSGIVPTVLLRVNRGRGRRIVQYERPLREDVPTSSLTESDVLESLLEEIVPFVTR
jgi:hypothetical protein